MVCQERYSNIVPSTFGTVIYRVLPPNINIHSLGFNPYSKQVQDLLKTTNLRIHLTQLHTLGDENLLENARQDVKVNCHIIFFSKKPHKILKCTYFQEKYFYAIYDMTVRGSCSCYGHADVCLPDQPEDADIPGMIHGKCDCKHNTRGANCELCLEDHNDVPGMPATGNKKNECKSKTQKLT